MTYAEVKFTVIIPDNEATDDEIKDWIAFEVGASSTLNDSTLSGEEIEIEDGTLKIECF